MATETSPGVGSLVQHGKRAAAAQAELGKQLADAAAASAPEVVAGER